MPARFPHDRTTFTNVVRGSILGGAIGDALGAPIEFLSLAGIRSAYGASGIADLVSGLITDDTQMTLFTLEGLLRTDVRLRQRGFCHVPSVVRHAYLRWLDTQQHNAPPSASAPHRTGWLREQHWLYARRAPGNACLSGLRAQPADQVPLGQPGRINPDSKGCGTVMRSAPFGLTTTDPRDAFTMAAECAQLTHGHPTGYLAAGAFAAIIFFLANGRSLRDAVDETLRILTEFPAHAETARAVHDAVALADQGDPAPEKVEQLGGAWIAEEALAIAIYCALVEPNVRRCLLLAVNHSGDSDSTGAVCGNLLGAMYGVAALPADWLARLEGRATITELADDFALQFTEGGPRSDAWSRRYPGN